MKRQLNTVKQPLKFDYILLLILLLISISSFIAIYASFPLIPVWLVPNKLLFNQILFYTLGFIAILIIIYLSNDNLKEFAILGYKIVLGLLVYLIIDYFLQRILGRSGNILPFANTVNGSTSWFLFPVIGTLQPSEFMKVILIIVCAYEIKDHNADKTDYSYSSDISLFLKILKWALLPMILILLQPDTGIFIIIAFALGLMVVCSGIRKEWIIGGFILVAVAAFIFFYLFYFDRNLFTALFGDSYRMQRIYGWLETESDILGNGMQLYQALLAIGSAGLLGHGLQSNAISITEPHTDFIFSIIGSNFGLIGCLIIVGLCIALDVRIIQIALRTKNQVEKLILCGFIAMLVFQQIQNIGMVIGLLPITGITLPMISYGGSSLLSYMLAMGIIMNTSLKAKKLSDYVY